LSNSVDWLKINKKFNWVTFSFGKFSSFELFTYTDGIVKLAETIWNCGGLPIFNYWFCKLRQLNLKNQKFGKFSAQFENN
jgi:hypothetical protein